MSFRTCRFILLPLVIAVSFLTWPRTEACSAVLSEEFNDTYTLPAGAHVSLFNKNGNVTIEGWNRNYVEVTAVKRTKRGRKELDRVRIDVLVDRDMKITTRYSGKTRYVSVTYDIRIPVTAMLKEVETTNGVVEVTDIQGDGSLTSVNGPVMLRRSAGNFNIETTNGSIKVRGLDGKVRGRTTNGSIDIEDAETVLGARTTNGAITLEIKAVPERPLEVKTINGAIEVLLAPDLNVDLNASTSSGSIESRGLEIITKKMSAGVLSGKLGAGGNLIRMRTSNGNIRIGRLD